MTYSTDPHLEARALPHGHAHSNHEHVHHEHGSEKFHARSSASLLQVSAFVRLAGAVFILVPLWIAVYAMVS